DLALVVGRSWSLTSGRYAAARIGGRAPRGSLVTMHRLIMGLEPGDPREVDHINGDGLDNRRANLRIVTRAQQAQNRLKIRGASRFRGVFRTTDGLPWRAEVRLKGRNYYLGRFSSEQEAARVAATWRREHMPYATC